MAPTGRRACASGAAASTVFTLLAMLAKEPSYGYQLRARLRDALGPLGEALNAGHVYLALTRLEKAGLLAAFG